MDLTSLLIIGYKLSLLSFSLGTLIYALPIPWRGLKIWGPRLVWDSISVTILLSIYYLLLETSNKISIMFGGSWEYFFSWIKSLIAFTLSLKELIVVAYAAAKALGPLRMLTSLLWPIDRLSNVLWLFLATIYGLSLFIRKYYFMLMALGLVLYAIPFRLGRSAGAWFIAFSLVFNSGLPLLPVFISMFYSNNESGVAPIINYGLVFVEANVTDYSQSPLSIGLVDLYIYDNSKPMLVGRYIVSNNGVLVTKYSSSYISMPSRKDVYAYLEIDSLKIPLQPFPIRTNNINIVGERQVLKLKVINMIWHKDALILITNSNKIRLVDVTRDHVKVVLNDEKYYVEVRAPEGCKYTINVKGIITKRESGDWTWLNVSGSYEKIYLNGSSTITLKALEGCYTVPNYPLPFDYYVDFLGRGIFLDIDFIRSLIVLFLTLPLLYLLLLFSIAYALARLIGGRERIIPRFI